MIDHEKKLYERKYRIVPKPISFLEDKAVRELVAKVQTNKTRGILQNIGSKIQKIRNDKYQAD